MFIMTTKLTKTKAIAGILIIGAILCGLIFAAGHLQKNSNNSIPSPNNIGDNDARIAYLSSWGWEVDPCAIETLDLVLPETFDESYQSYNSIQAETNMDLTEYCGKHIKRYTYTVLNYPDEIENVQANLYLYENTVIAGDIMMPGTNGFIASLQYPRS